VDGDPADLAEARLVAGPAPAGPCPRGGGGKDGAAPRPRDPPLHRPDPSRPLALTASDGASRISNGPHVMPIYEYHCADCRRRVSLLVMRISDPGTPRCPPGGSGQLTRLMSRVAAIRAGDDRPRALARPRQRRGPGPESVGRWMKKVGGELGDEATEDWDEMVEEAVEQEAGGDGPAPEASDTAENL